MTYGGKSYADVITVEDKSDPYVSEMLSIGGFTVKNNLGGVVPYVIVRTNQKEVDALLGNIGETAPSSPKSGDFWYKVDHTAQSVVLMKYDGAEWKNATEKQTLTYTWYMQDKDGKAITFEKSGKVIYLSAKDIDSLVTLQCDVSKGIGGGLMALLTTCQASFQSMKDYEDVKDDVESLKENIHECYSEISKTSEQIQHTVRETYLTKSELETIQKTFKASHYTEQFRNTEWTSQR